MAKSLEKLLIVCVDRDDDLGRKTGVQGPVVGEQKNLDAASRLALADPAESDANCIFAAVKKFREIRNSHPNAEIVTLTGHGKRGFESDRVLNRQIDAVLESLGGVDGFVLVTDGAEDDQVIPLLQSRAKIFSKETVIVKQAQVVESTYYTIKEALKDPFLARIVFGIPGIILLLFVALGTVSLQIVSLVFGVYLILKGFGIEEKILSLSKGFTTSISVQRTSFPFYIASFFILVFGLVTAYNGFASTPLVDPLIDGLVIVRSIYFFIILAAITLIIAKGIDSVHLARAFELRGHFLSAASIVLIWFILDTGTLVFLRQADLNLFLFVVLTSFGVLLAAFKVSMVMDVRERITKLLVGLPVYDAMGNWAGKVESIDKRKNTIAYSDVKTKKETEVNRKKFSIASGRIILSA